MTGGQRFKTVIYDGDVGCVSVTREVVLHEFGMSLTWVGRV